MIKNYTPIMWDYKSFTFIPVETFGANPSYSEAKCSQICEELNKLVKLCSFAPKAGDIYYHPVTFVNGKFIVMDNQAASDKCPYPACADQENCQKVCDLMNRVLEEK